MTRLQGRKTTTFFENLKDSPFPSPSLITILLPPPLISIKDKDQEKDPLLYLVPSAKKSKLRASLGVLGLTLT